MRLCKLFKVIACEMQQSKRNTAYKLVRDIIRVRRDLNIRDDVADLLAKRHLLNNVLSEKYWVVDLQDLLRDIFELDTVWEYLVSKDALDPPSNENDADVDDDTDDRDDDKTDDDDNDNDEDEDDDSNDADLSSTNEVIVKYVNVNQVSGGAFLTFLTIMNTIMSSVILCKMLMNE